MKLLFQIQSFDFKNTSSLINKVKKKFIISPWVINTLNKVKIKKKYDYPIKIIEINLKKDLKIFKPTYLYLIYKRIEKKGYNLIYPEIAIYSCLFLKNNRPGTWSRFATPLRSLIDDDKIPHLPKFGRGLNKNFIETYWAYRKAIFHPHNNFIVTKK